MSCVNPVNERIKRRYLEYLRETLGLAETTIDQAAAAIFNFEQFTDRADFKRWSLKKALAYKKMVVAAASKRTGALASRATVVGKLRSVKNFFLWLAVQPGYRSKITRAEVEHLAPTRRDARLARVASARPAPTIEQARHVVFSMPASTDVELRNRALVTCALLTGARVSALITLKLKHVRADRLGIDQDASEVHTKFAKSQTTYFFPVGDDLKTVFFNYIDHLTHVLHWGANDPLFAKTHQSSSVGRTFEVMGLGREHWKTPDPVRKIFKAAFATAGLPYYSPHSFRNCIMNLGERICRTPEELKAFSQNLGHDEVRTSLNSYGAITSKRQAELLSQMSHEEPLDEKAARLGRLMLENPAIAAIIRESMAGVDG